MPLSSLLFLIGAVVLVAVCLVVILRRNRSASGHAPVSSAASLDAQATGEANRGADRQGRS